MTGEGAAVLEEVARNCSHRRQSRGRHERQPGLQPHGAGHRFQQAVWEGSTAPDQEPCSQTPDPILSPSNTNSQSKALSQEVD